MSLLISGGIDFSPFYNFDIILWNYSDSVVPFVFDIIFWNYSDSVVPLVFDIIFWNYFDSVVPPDIANSCPFPFLVWYSHFNKRWRGLSQFYGTNPSLTERYFQKNNMKRSSHSKRIGYPTNMRWITIVF
jgi:hypothetical protein